MGIKRIVDTAFWNDEKVIDMFSPEDKLFMLYLLTNPHTTQLGIYKVHEKEMAFEIGYSVDAVNVLLDRFETKYKMISRSRETKEIAIKNFLRHSIVKGGKPVEDLLIKEIKSVKDRRLLAFIYSYLVNFDNLNETVNKILNYIKNEYVNDNDNDNEESYHDSYDDSYSESFPEVSPKNYSHSAKAFDYDEFARIYNSVCNNLSKVTILSDKRKKAIREFCKQLSVDNFREACEKANNSDFCTGNNDRGWKADFDFIIRVDKALSLIEGKYNNIILFTPKQPTAKHRPAEAMPKSFEPNDMIEKNILSSYPQELAMQMIEDLRKQNKGE